MNGSGKAGNGRGNNRRRPFKHHNNDKKNNNPKNDYQKREASNNRGEKPNSRERPKWTPPKINTVPLPVPNCSWCNKPIREISQAINDNNTGLPVHFDCVTAKISENERLDKGDSVTYIGGGRFGIVNFSNPGNPKNSNSFKIKKIIEWENNEKKAAWRDEIHEHFLVT